MTRTGREIFPNDTYWRQAYAIKDGQLKPGELLASAGEISRTRGASDDEV